MEAKRCKFWLPRKSRFCANAPLNDSLFCGNHNPKSEEQRIPCPLDPSHSVLKEQLEVHLKKCPLLKQVQTLSQQPYYRKGINGGTDEEEQEKEQYPISENPLDCLTKGSSDVTTSDMKRNAVYAMSLGDFFGLIEKIKSIHGSLCSNIQDSYKITEACNMWMNKEVDRKVPFQEKHVLQQASILGNMEEFGVLENKVVCSTGNEEQLPCYESSGDDNKVPAVVEFGAGRGYLTQMLADCYGIRQVYLVERRSYKLKADRSLRQKDSLRLERLRIDIEDLDLSSVQPLKETPYLGVGKHLCGPATDLALRCCLSEQSSQANAELASDNCTLRGLAIATCCHHLCQWKSYINKDYLLKMGITKDNFHAVTWFTSWAVDADYSSDFSEMGDLGSCLSFISNSSSKECGANFSRVEVIVRNIPALQRAALGFMCKEIIDVGRLMWLKEHSLEAQLLKYVPSSISPENHLLVAKQRNGLKH